MFDGLAVESKCRYCSEWNHIIGLCHEHSKNVNTEVIDLESIETIRKALFSELDPEKKVCFGNDATIVAIAPYA